MRASCGVFLAAAVLFTGCSSPTSSPTASTAPTDPVVSDTPVASATPAKVTTYGQWVKLADYNSLDIKDYAPKADSEYSGVAIGALVRASTFDGYSPQALTQVETALGIFMDDKDTTKAQKAALLKRTNELMVLETVAELEDIKITDAEYKAMLDYLYESTQGQYASAAEYETAIGKDVIMKDVLAKKIEQFLVLKIAENQNIAVTDAEYKDMLTKLYQRDGADVYKSEAEYEAALGTDYIKYYILSGKIGAVWPEK